MIKYFLCIHLSHDSPPERPVLLINIYLFMNKKLNTHISLPKVLYEITNIEAFDLKEEVKAIMNTINDYESLLENLRTRLNVLNTSIFLLEDNIGDKTKKTDKYLKQINSELKRIRELIVDFPEDYAG